jgi:hypothetical protein
MITKYIIDRESWKTLSDENKRKDVVVVKVEDLISWIKERKKVSHGSRWVGIHDDIKILEEELT